MKTYLFVDGSNLYAAQYELFGPKKYLNFSILIKELQEKIKVKFDKIYFYASYSPKSKKPTKKQKLYLKNEALFYRSVRKTKNTIFFKGYRSKTSGKEKGVDVKLAADLVSFAFLDRYDIVYLFSGDADFLQALFNVRQFCTNKKIFILCFKNKIMYKGAFHFQSHIVNFDRSKMKFHRSQKIKLVRIRKEDVVVSAKKIPDMHACRVS